MTEETPIEKRRSAAIATLKKKREWPPGTDPLKAFFLAVSIGNLDGSLDELGGEGVEGLCATEEQATELLTELNQTYPTLNGFVYHCVPVARVWRGVTRITKIPVRKQGPKK